MALSIRMYPARNGDAFLVTRDDDVPTALLIDGGYTSTVRDYIAPDLRDLARYGRSLDLAVATHVDADHISGFLHLIDTNGAAQAPRIIQIREVWHNSLRSIQALSRSDAVTDDIGAIQGGDADLLDHIRCQGYPEPPALAPDATAEIGARQGSSLAALLLGSDYRWNGATGENPIVRASRIDRITVTDGTAITLLGPPASQLQALGKWWVRELRRFGFTGPVGRGLPFDDAFEFLAASCDEPTTTNGEQISGSQSPSNASLSETHVPDTSPTNASSISFILHSGTCRVLFLADAWAEDILAALRNIAVVDGSLPGSPLVFDAIKVAHHGSRRNTSVELLELIDAPRYLISTNGEQHDHPDLEVLKAIVDRPAPFTRELFFNYSTVASQAMKAYSSIMGAAFEIREGVREILIPDAYKVTRRVGK